MKSTRAALLACVFSAALLGQHVSQPPSGSGGSSTPMTPVDLGSVGTTSKELPVGSTSKRFTVTLTGDPTFTVTGTGSAPFCLVITQQDPGGHSPIFDSSFASAGTVAADANSKSTQCWYWVGTAGIATPLGDMTYVGATPGVYFPGTGVTLLPPPTTGAPAMASDIVTMVKTDQSNIYTAGTDDHGSADHTMPSRRGLAASKPATCTVGEEYFATDATAGQNKYFCTSTDTWTQQLNSGGSQPYSAFHALQSGTTLTGGTDNLTGGSFTVPAGDLGTGGCAVIRFHLWKSALANGYVAKLLFSDGTTSATYSFASSTSNNKIWYEAEFCNTGATNTNQISPYVNAGTIATTAPTTGLTIDTSQAVTVTLQAAGTLGDSISIQDASVRVRR